MRENRSRRDGMLIIVVLAMLVVVGDWHVPTTASASGSSSTTAATTTTTTTVTTTASTTTSPTTTASGTTTTASGTTTTVTPTSTTASATTTASTTTTTPATTTTPTTTTTTPTTTTTTPTTTTTTPTTTTTTAPPPTIINSTKVSRTHTQPLPLGTIVQNTYGLDQSRLQRPLTFPPASIHLAVVNDLFVLSDECKRDIAVSGPGWLGEELISSIDTVVSATIASASSSDSSATSAGGAFFPTFPNDIPGGPRDSDGSVAGLLGETASVISIVFKGTDLFAPSLTSIYNLTIPASCMVSGAAPKNNWSLFFRVYGVGSDVSLSMAIAFCGYLAGAFAFIAAFMGSVTPLLILHVFAVSMMTSCGPTAMFSEFDSLKLVLMPIDITIGDLPYSARYVVWTIVLTLIFAVGEGTRMLLIRLGVQFDCSSRDTEMDDLEAGGKKKKKKGTANKADQHQDSAASQRSQALIVPEQEGDAEDADAAGDPGVEPTDEEKRITAERAFEAQASKSTVMIQPPYILVCFVITAFAGLIANCVASLLSGIEVAAGVSGMSGLCLLVAGLGLPLAAYGFGRRNRFHFCTYTSVLGNLRSWIQPSGVWGPNSLRLRCGAFIDDTAEGKRFFTSILLLYVVVTSVAIGSSPSKDASCRAVLAVCVSTTIIMILLIYALFPLRSTFLNIGALVSLAFLLSFQVSLLTFITTVAPDCGYIWSRSGVLETSCNSTSVVVAQYVLGVLTCLSCATVAVVHIYVLFLEVKGRTAYLHVRAYKRHQLNALSSDPKQEEIRLNNQIEELCEIIDKHSAVVDDDGQQEAMSGPSENTASNVGSKAQQARRERTLADIKARQEAADRHVRNRGIRAVHEQVRPPRTFIPGDATHPSMADYLVQDYSLVPEDTRREYRMLAQMRRDRENQFASNKRNRGQSGTSQRDFTL